MTNFDAQEPSGTSVPCDGHEQGLIGCLRVEPRNRKFDQTGQRRRLSHLKLSSKKAMLSEKRRGTADVQVNGRIEGI